MDTDITELEELGAEKVSGVGTPANGTPWLMLKAAEDGGIDPGSDAGTDDSSEAEEIEEELTKAVDQGAYFLGLLHDYAIKGVCTEQDILAVQKFVDSLEPMVLEKAKLKAKQRNALPNSAFAYIDSKGGRHLPIQDADHVHSALGRIAEQHFDHPGDRAKAQAKIDAKAKELGIHLEKSPGVPAESVAMPKVKSKLKSQARSKVAGPMTTGLKPPMIDPSFAEGGDSTYTIPIDGKLKTNKRPPSRRSRRLAMEKESWTIEVVSKEDATNWMSADNPVPEPAPAETETPGDGPWETYDADTLDSVAHGLAAAMRAVNSIRQREVIEAVSGDASDWMDAMQLDMASGSLADALGLVAALAYHEAAAEGTKKSASQAVLDAVTSHLPKGDEQQAAKNGPKTSEEDEIMTTVTKEELAKLVADTAKKSVKDALKAQANTLAKAQKKAKKNANNGGDITAGEMEDKVTGHVDADDIKAVGGKVQRQFINKSKKEDKAIKQIVSTVADLSETVAKMASRPRSGGPVLDGQARGTFMAAEGRLSEGVSKSAEDTNIEKLEKELDGARTEESRQAITTALLHARLVQAHTSGQI